MFTLFLVHTSFLHIGTTGRRLCMKGVGLYCACWEKGIMVNENSTGLSVITR